MNSIPGYDVPIGFRFRLELAFGHHDSASYQLQAKGQVVVSTS
jgi:hypothetical protein